MGFFKFSSDVVWCRTISVVELVKEAEQAAQSGLNFGYNDQCVTMWAGNEKYWVSVLYTTLHYMDLHFQKVTPTIKPNFNNDLK